MRVSTGRSDARPSRRGRAIRRSEACSEKSARPRVRRGPRTRAVLHRGQCGQGVPAEDDSIADSLLGQERPEPMAAHRGDLVRLRPRRLRRDGQGEHPQRRVLVAARGSTATSSRPDAFISRRAVSAWRRAPPAHGGRGDRCDAGAGAVRVERQPEGVLEPLVAVPDRFAEPPDLGQLGTRLDWRCAWRERAERSGGAALRERRGCPGSRSEGAATPGLRSSAWPRSARFFRRLETLELSGERHLEPAQPTSP